VHLKKKRVERVNEMRRFLIYFIAIALGIILESFFPLPGHNGQYVYAKNNNKGDIKRNIQYSFTIQNTTNHLLAKANLWTYAPVKSNSLQDCLRIKISHPYKLISDRHGNQILHFTILNIAPFSTKSVTIMANLVMRRNPKIVNVGDLQTYLQPEKYIESNHAEIKKLAYSLKGATAKDTAKKIFNWVSNNITSEAYSSYDRGALYARKERKGDCTEIAYLFVALCRSNKIPARAVGGYICPESTILSAAEYHNWAEVYLNGSWQVADPQNNIFLKKQDNYIAMRIIDNVKKNPMSNYHRFRFDGEGLKVTMN